MDSLLLKNGSILLETGIIPNGFVLVEGGKIKAAGPMNELPSVEKETHIVDLQGKHTVVPGFIDIHIHGAAGADTMDATPQALQTMATALPREGTTSFLATTITQEAASIERALQNAATFGSKPGQAELLGVHLEGPFINTVRAGAQPKDSILQPDIELFKKWQAAANDQIKLVTMAPELENGLEFVRYLASTGVIASVGHSDALFTDVEAAVEAGANHVTHLFNGMRGMHHREPGVAGSALLFEKIMLEMIADGIHIHPEMVKLVMKAKGVDGVILITDSMRAKGLQDGTYELGGQEVTVADGKAVLADGTLAGSILKMDDAVKNIIGFASVTLEQACKMASTNPAKQLKVFDRKGSIAPGKDADLVVLDENLNVKQTYCRGV